MILKAMVVIGVGPENCSRDICSDDDVGGESGSGDGDDDDDH